MREVFKVYVAFRSAQTTPKEFSIKSVEETISAQHLKNSRHRFEGKNFQISDALTNE